MVAVEVEVEGVGRDGGRQAGLQVRRVVQSKERTRTLPEINKTNSFSVQWQHDASTFDRV